MKKCPTILVVLFIVILAVSAVETIETSYATNLWPIIKTELAPHNAVLDRACVALHAGPVKFQPGVRPGGDILLPHLPDYKRLAQALSVRTALSIHEHQTNDVFTNLFALTRMVTA